MFCSGAISPQALRVEHGSSQEGDALSSDTGVDNLKTRKTGWARLDLQMSQATSNYGTVVSRESTRWVALACPRAHFFAPCVFVEKAAAARVMNEWVAKSYPGCCLYAIYSCCSPQRALACGARFPLAAAAAAASALWFSFATPSLDAQPLLPDAGDR